MDLTTEEAEVRYGREVALRSLSLSFPLGSQALIVGRAASGKTSLLKLLAGLRLPSAGRLLWNEEDVSKLGATDRRARQGTFGFIFQSDALFDSMTVLQNVALPLERRGVSSAEAASRSQALLAEVGLGNAVGARPQQLSGGMKKRAGIARALIAQPQVLLADDPLAGLDPETRREIAALLRNASRGKTLIVAAPEAPDELPLERCLRVDCGAITFDGPLAELRADDDLEAMR